MSDLSRLLPAADRPYFLSPRSQTILLFSIYLSAMSMNAPRTFLFPRPVFRHDPAHSSEATKPTDDPSSIQAATAQIVPGFGVRNIQQTRRPLATKDNNESLGPNRHPARSSAVQSLQALTSSRSILAPRFAGTSKVGRKNVAKATSRQALRFANHLASGDGRRPPLAAKLPVSPTNKARFMQSPSKHDSPKKSLQPEHPVHLAFKGRPKGTSNYIHSSIH